MPVVYGTVGSRMKWPLAWYFAFEMLFLHSWGRGRGTWVTGRVDVAPEYRPRKTDNKSSPAAFESNLFVYFWNIFAVIVHQLYFTFLLVYFLSLDCHGKPLPRWMRKFPSHHFASWSKADLQRKTRMSKWRGTWQHLKDFGSLCSPTQSSFQFSHL